MSASTVRFMRSLLMFDLPVETAKERKEYQQFVKFLKGEGFIMFQKSIYVKLSINEASVKLLEKTIRNNLPKDGIISMLTLTENQFNSICVLLGDIKNDVITSLDRVIDL